MDDMLERMANDLIAGKEENIADLTRAALDKGYTAKAILDNGLLAGMTVVGRRFKSGEMYMPEVLLCAHCMHAAMDILKPLLSDGEADSTGTVVIGTVEGDLHDIGKNLVAMMMQGAGFKVIDLGTNIPPQAFVEAVKTHQPQILGMSALLTTTLPKMGATIEALKTAGVRDQVKIMAGGAPVTQEFVDMIGADAYGENAVAASEKAKALLA